MSKELIVSATRNETRVAILEDDQLVEIYHQREKEYSLAGSIHKGRVTRVLPGMQSAFVDIGLERDAFLYVSDFFEDNEEYDKIVSGVEEKVLKLEKGSPVTAGPVSLAPPMEPEMAAVLGAVPGALLSGSPTAASPQTNGAPAASGNPIASSNGDPRRGGGRDNQDSRDGRGGGRGRRGRRRRPGAGGLPESKFFSPREGQSSSREPSGRETPVRESRESHPPSASDEAQEESTGGLIVLPGESISKYVGQTASREDVPVATAEPPAIEPWSYEETDPGDAFAPETEQPSAGAEALSAVPVGDESESERDAAEEVQAQAELAHEPVLTASVDEVVIEAVHQVTFEEESADDERSDLPAPSEFDPESRNSDEQFSVDPPSRETSGEAFEEASETSAESGNTEMDPTPLAAEGEADPNEADPNEGPEPARIPQSLTAALREQGGRLPHRISRRSRRRQRGERGPESQTATPEQPVAAGTPAASVPVDIKAPSDRGQGNRNPRPDRGRDDRPREDRPREERGREERSAHSDDARPVLPSITDLLKSGQEIIVQIAKEPLGQKGARITSHIALPGRFLVYMPTVDHIGVSRKIPSDDERLRLKRILQTHRAGIPGGFIVRTAGENRSEEELRADMMFLYSLWMDMRQKAEKKPAPFLLHHDLDVVERILRDQLTNAFKTVWVDNELVYESVLSFVQRFQPAMVSRIKLYTRPTPIFDEFGITQELEKALRPKVWLKSGGYIVINQTEALVAIDINTGKYVGKSNRLEDTIVKINTDAIKEIVRQIRLRDLGGIIVVDFIDMDERKNRQKVMQVLEESMRVDRAPYKILQFNDFGLVAITRKRVKQSLERTLCSPCPYCEAAGYIKSVQTVITEILQEAHKIVKAVDGDNVMLRVNPEVAKVLKSNTNDHLEEIEAILGKTLIVKSDPLLHQTKFDLA